MLENHNKEYCKPVRTIAEYRHKKTMIEVALTPIYFGEFRMRILKQIDEIKTAQPLHKHVVIEIKNTQKCWNNEGRLGISRGLSKKMRKKIGYTPYIYPVSGYDWVSRDNKRIGFQSYVPTTHLVRELIAIGFSVTVVSTKGYFIPKNWYEEPSINYGTPDQLDHPSKDDYENSRPWAELAEFINRGIYHDKWHHLAMQLQQDLIDLCDVYRYIPSMNDLESMRDNFDNYKVDNSYQYDGASVEYVRQFVDEGITGRVADTYHKDGLTANTFNLIAIRCPHCRKITFARERNTNSLDFYSVEYFSAQTEQERQLQACDSEYFKDDKKDPNDSDTFIMYEDVNVLAFCDRCGEELTRTDILLGREDLEREQDVEYNNYSIKAVKAAEKAAKAKKTKKSSTIVIVRESRKAAKEKAQPVRQTKPCAALLKQMHK